jgi:tRNA G37 N-methylase Trm5
MNKKGLTISVIIAAVAVLAGVLVYAQTSKKSPDVPYVPTSHKKVEEMLKLANVGKDDIVYDLGSGDGRIPIAAVKDFGAKRAVGIDINPERVKEANENNKKAKLTDKVKFIEGDLFEQDFSEATVVTLYLLPAVNLKLRPKILALKPGTRIVSHSFDMGDWTPDKTIEVEGANIYFWTVPEKK